MGHGYIVVLKKNFRIDPANEKISRQFLEFWAVQIDKRALRIEEVTAAMYGQRLPEGILTLHDPRIVRRIKMVSESLRCTLDNSDQAFGRRVIWHDCEEIDFNKQFQKAERFIKRLAKRKKKHVRSI